MQVESGQKKRGSRLAHLLPLILLKNNIPRSGWPYYIRFHSGVKTLFFPSQKGGRKGQLPPALYCL